MQTTFRYTVCIIYPWSSLSLEATGQQLNLINDTAIGFLNVFATRAEAEAFRADTRYPDAQILTLTGEMKS